MVNWRPLPAAGSKARPGPRHRGTPDSGSRESRSSAPAMKSRAFSAWPTKTPSSSINSGSWTMLRCRCMPGSHAQGTLPQTRRRLPFARRGIAEVNAAQNLRRARMIRQGAGGPLLARLRISGFRRFRFAHGAKVPPRRARVNDGMMCADPARLTR